MRNNGGNHEPLPIPRIALSERKLALFASLRFGGGRMDDGYLIRHSLLSECFMRKSSASLYA